MTPASDFQKKKIVQLAREESLRQLKGDRKKAGVEIEEFLSPFREELGKSDRRFSDMSFGSDWCAMFVYYLVITAGYTLNIKPFKDKRGTFALVGIWFEWAVFNRKFKEISYEPKSGDLILYDKLLSDSELDHIGVILENKSNYFITAEGNIHNMTGVFKRLKYDNIRGYITL